MAGHNEYYLLFPYEVQPDGFLIDWSDAPAPPATAEEVIARFSPSTTPFETPDWEDITDDLMEIHIRRGRQYERDVFEAGTCELRLRNTHGYYWPNNNASPFYPDCRPNRRMQIRKVYGGIEYILYTGFVEKWKPTWVGEHALGAVVDVSLTDLFGSLANIEIDALDATNEFVDELSGTRVGRVLTALGWTNTEATVDAGDTTIAAPDGLTVEIMLNGIDHLQEVAQLEGGQIYVRPDGNVRFEERYERMTNHMTSLATFGNTTGDMKVSGYDLSYDNEHIYNEVKVSPDSGDTWQTWSDANSISLYGKRSLLVQLPMASDADALALAQHLVLVYKMPKLVVKSLTIKVGSDMAGLAPKAWGYDISSCITVRLSQVVNGVDVASINQLMWIEGIEHNWTVQEPTNWETKWFLSPCVGYYWMLEDATYGKLEQTTALGY